MSLLSATSQPNTTSLPLYLMTSTQNIYQVEGRLFGDTEQAEVSANFSTITAPLLDETNGKVVNDKTLNEQITYLNQAVKAGFYAWSPVVTKDNPVSIKVTLSPAQGVVKPFGDESYSSGLAYALSCSLCMALKLGWCGQDDMPITPYFCTGKVSENGNVGAIGDLIKKVGVVLKYIAPQFPLLTVEKQEPNLPPLFCILLPSANYNKESNELIGENVPNIEQLEWLKLIDEVKGRGGKVIPLTHISEGLSLLLGDAFIPSSDFGIEQTPMGLKAINYTNRRHFFARKLKVEELAEYAEKAYSKSVLTVTGFSGSGRRLSISISRRAQKKAASPSF